MNRHTPGPWHLISVGDGPETLAVADATRTSLLTVVTEGRTYFAGVYEDADARLIAAAPDLLDALKDALCCLEVCGKDYDYAVGKASAAIAKATGATE